MSAGVGEVLWRPSDARVAAARVTAFRTLVNRRHGLDLADHDDLYRWSLRDRPAFWRAVWDFCGVRGEDPGPRILCEDGPMPSGRWFPDARLNYAENLLQGDAQEVVLLFSDEGGDRLTLTRGELRRQVARVAAALRADGVEPGDRVAGYLPNEPRTVVAMLAAASLGAVWASCSPDFGLQAVLDRFAQIGPKVLFAADGYTYGSKPHSVRPVVEALGRRLDTLVRVVSVADDPGCGPAPAGTTSWADYLGPEGPSEPGYLRVPFAHPLFILFSSGTTGLPKCLVHSVGGTLLQHLKEHQLHCDLGPADRLFYYTTCGWMMWNWLVSGLASGAAIVLYEGNPLAPRTALWDLAQRRRITVFGTSARWLAAGRKFGLAPARTHDLGALRAVLSTGSPLAPDAFDYVYAQVKADVQLSSISGGTDIVSCFALGSPVLPVRRGELQCRGLGMQVEVFDPQGRPLQGAKGELVCTANFPSMPTGFWNDPDGARYRKAYFERYPGVWCHGDFAELTASGGVIIHGRSDTVLNPGGVRIGTGEIYRIVETFDDVLESLVVGQDHEGDVRILLFVVLREGRALTAGLIEDMKKRIRRQASPRHVPARIVQAPAIPRTVSGKVVELAVRRILQGQPVENADALADPQALEFFRRLAAELD